MGPVMLQVEYRRALLIRGLTHGPPTASALQPRLTFALIMHS